MADDFKVGDVVVRVGAKRADCPPRTKINEQRFPAPPTRKLLRVDGLVNGPGWQSLIFVGYPSEHSTRGWHGAAFRKLDAPHRDRRSHPRLPALALVGPGMTALYFIGGAPLRCPDLEAFWNDPAVRERDAQLRAANRTRCHSAIDAGMARLNEIQAARWAAEEQGE